MVQMSARIRELEEALAAECRVRSLCSIDVRTDFFHWAQPVHPLLNEECLEIKNLSVFYELGSNQQNKQTLGSANETSMDLTFDEIFGLPQDPLEAFQPTDASGLHSFSFIINHAIMH